MLDSESLLPWDDVWEATENEKVDPQQPRQPWGEGFSGSCLVWEGLGHLGRGSQSRTDKVRGWDRRDKAILSTENIPLQAELLWAWKGEHLVDGRWCRFRSSAVVNRSLWHRKALPCGLHTQLFFHSTGRSEGQGDKSQCSLPAVQLPSVLWRGPEGLLLLLTQVPQKLSRKSCYLKWKQSLQPGEMPCGEVSRLWLSQEITCQFGI